MEICITKILVGITPVEIGVLRISTVVTQIVMAKAPVGIGVSPFHTGFLATALSEATSGSR